MYILVALAFAFGAAVVMAMYMGAMKVPGMLAQRQLQGRLTQLSATPEVEEEQATLLVKVQHKGPLPAIDRMLGGTTRGSAIGRWIDQSGMKASISGVLLISTVLAGILGVLAAMLLRAGWALFLGGAVGFPAAVPRAENQTRPPDARLRRTVPGGPGPDLPRAQGRTRVRDRPEDGRRRDAGAGRSRVPQDVRRAELRPADERFARKPVVSAFRCSTCGSSRPRS
jgi:hypothetical protein